MGCTSSSSSDVSSSNRNLPKVIFVTGAPGAGKRTQCAKVVQKYGFAHIVILDCLKKAVEEQTEAGKSVQQCLSEGKLVPSKLVCEILDNHLSGISDKTILIEGFPKSLDNLDAWNARFNGRYHVQYCFYFHCDRNVLEKRLQKRATESHREDDSIQVIKKRLDTYEQTTRPVIASFNKTKNIIHINSQRKMESVFNQICGYVDLFINHIEVRSPEVIFLSGGVGSGRNTQLKRISDKYKFTCINTQQVLSKAGENNQEIKALMAKGEMVSSDQVVNLLAEEMDNNPSQVYVISGFPKNLDNWQSWNRKMSMVTHVKMLVNFQCSEKVMKARIQHNDPNANLELISKRHSAFNSSIGPVNDIMSKLEKLVTINAERPLDSVTRAIFNEIDEKLFGHRIELPKAVFVVGGPGAGKGTQCTKIKEAMGFHHYSTGDLLRAEVASGSILSAQIKKIQDQGGLVGSDLVVEILRVNLEYKRGKFLLDGFPRNQENIDSWNKHMKGVCDLEFLLNFDVEPTIMQERMLERAKTSGRSDDNPETIKKRLETFQKETKPIIDTYARQNKLVTINADGDVETVFSRVKAQIKQRITDFENRVPKVVFLAGGPGCGKGTQCDLIKEKYRIFHHSPGDLLREEVSKGGQMANEIRRIQNDGKLVPSGIVIDLLKSRIVNNPGLHLVDGFPRNFENIDLWNKKMMKFCDVQFMLYFECPQQEMEKRALGRATSSGRSDDNPETIKKRIETFVKITTPLVNWFQSQNKVEVIATDQPKDKVFEAVQKVFDSRLPWTKK